MSRTHIYKENLLSLPSMPSCTSVNDKSSFRLIFNNPMGFRRQYDMNMTIHASTKCFQYFDPMAFYC